MTTQHLLDHFAEPKVPHWAKFHVVIHAEDGAHHKYYQGFAGAEREFRRQIGEDKNLRSYMIDKLLGAGHEEGAAENLTVNWTLERHVGVHGSFQVVDDYGRRITIERVYP